jgi:hypothetical protein
MKPLALLAGFTAGGALGYLATRYLFAIPPRTVYRKGFTPRER